MPQRIDNGSEQVYVIRPNILECFVFLFVVAYSKPSSSTVADMVHNLIKLGSMLTSCEDDQAKTVQCEVANCLGEIGPVDLSAVSLGCKNKGKTLG